MQLLRLEWALPSLPQRGDDSAQRPGTKRLGHRLSLSSSEFLLLH